MTDLQSRLDELEKFFDHDVQIDLSRLPYIYVRSKGKAICLTEKVVMRLTKDDFASIASDMYKGNLEQRKRRSTITPVESPTLTTIKHTDRVSDLKGALKTIVKESAEAKRNEKSRKKRK